MAMHTGSAAQSTSLSSAAFPLVGPVGSASAPTYAAGAANTGVYSASAGADISVSIGGTRVLAIQATNIQLLSDAAVIYLGAGADTLIARDAANVVALKNSTTAQTFRVYGTTTGPKYASLAHDGTNLILSEVGGGNININTADVAAASAVVAHIATSTIAGGVTDGYTGSLRITPTYTAATALTVTRHNYFDLNTPTLSGAGPAALTDACVFRFNAAAGTHKAVDGSSTKTTPGSVQAWVKWNVNGTIHYTPAYTSKTA